MIFIVITYFALFLSLFTGVIFLLTYFENLKNLKNPKITKYPTVCIVIPAHNEEKSISKTIESALNIDYPKDKLEIYVIENGGSSDDTYKIAKKYSKKGIKIFSIKKGGKGNAMNYVMKKTNSEIFITMDADTYADSDVLKKMLGYFRDPRVMAVTPTMKSKFNETFIQKMQNVEYLVGAFLRKVFHFLNSIYVTPGAFTAYRKEFFDKYGGFDEKNITEDIELSMRIQSKRYKIANAFNASVFTITPNKFLDLFWQRVRWYLGYIETMIQYRRVIYSKNYGYLGLLIGPVATISIFYILYLTLSLIYKLIISIVGIYFIKDYLSTPSVLFENIRFSPFFFNFSLPIYVGFIALLMTIFMFYVAKRHSNDTSEFKFGYILFTLFYISLSAIWWFSAIFYKFFGNELRFGGVVWNKSFINYFKHKLT
tara:strand:+ start:49 stop:1326 length:1278 start_codon:yes stop_codon:yes gene_type:complete